MRRTLNLTCTRKGCTCTAYYDDEAGHWCRRCGHPMRSQPVPTYGAKLTAELKQSCGEPLTDDDRRALRYWRRRA